MIKPGQVELRCGIYLADAFGKFETEAAAMLVVLWHLQHGHDDWVPVTRRQIIEMIEQHARDKVEPICKLVTNPFWKPEPNLLRDGGWISGWKNADDPGMFTEDGLRALAERGSYREILVGREQSRSRSGGGT